MRYRKIKTVDKKNILRLVTPPKSLEKNFHHMAIVTEKNEDNFILISKELDAYEMSNGYKVIFIIYKTSNLDDMLRSRNSFMLDDISYSIVYVMIIPHYSKRRSSTCEYKLKNAIEIFEDKKTLWKHSIIDSEFEGNNPASYVYTNPRDLETVYYNATIVTKGPVLRVAPNNNTKLEEIKYAFFEGDYHLSKITELISDTITERKWTDEEQQKLFDIDNKNIRVALATNKHVSRFIQDKLVNSKESLSFYIPALMENEYIEHSTRKKYYKEQQKLVQSNQLASQIILQYL